LNVAMIIAWPADGTYNNIAWALFAASVGGAGGTGIGIFEARAINRATAAERHRIRHEELEQRNEQLKDFASIVSHDLRNPLSVATGRVTLLQEECDDDSLNAVASAHERIDTIIERTLTLARTGQTIEDTEAVELDAIVHGCWDTVSTMGATIEVDNSAAIVADRDRLRHLFENLFRNGIEHAGEDVSIRVGVTKDGFYVEDDGPGIPKADREEVFEVGHSTSEDGTGFGLRIVEQAVEAHGWDIDIAEAADGGARFEITGVEFSAT